MAEVYAVYKIWHGNKTVIAYCDDQAEAVAAMEEEMKKTDDNAQYIMHKEETK